MTATAANLKRWIANHEAVNDRVTEERRLLTPAASFRKALRVGVLHHQVSAPVPAASIEEALRVHRTWVKSMLTIFQATKRAAHLALPQRGPRNQSRADQIG